MNSRTSVLVAWLLIAPGPVLALGLWVWFVTRDRRR